MSPLLFPPVPVFGFRAIPPLWGPYIEGSGCSTETVPLVVCRAPLIHSDARSGTKEAPLAQSPIFLVGVFFPPRVVLPLVDGKQKRTDASSFRDVFPLPSCPRTGRNEEILVA